MAVDWSQFKPAAPPKPSIDWGQFKPLDPFGDVVDGVSSTAAPSFGNVQPGIESTAPLMAVPEDSYIPDRTNEETINDTATRIRQGLNSVVGGVVGAPVNIANMILTSPIQRALNKAQGIPTDDIEQPDFVKGIRQELGYDNEREGEGLSAKAKAQAEQFQKTDGLVDSLGFLARNPSYLGTEAAAQIPQFLQIAPGSMVGTVAAQAAGAASQNAQQVEEELRKKGLSEAEIQDRLANAFGQSFALNAALPMIPGGSSFERVLSGQKGNLVGSAAKRLLKPVVGETVAEGSQEGLDQVVQNYATGNPIGQGVGQAAALGGVLGTGTGSIAGLSDMARGRVNQDGLTPEQRRATQLGIELERQRKQQDVQEEGTPELVRDAGPRAFTPEPLMDIGERASTPESEAMDAGAAATASIFAAAGANLVSEPILNQPVEEVKSFDTGIPVTEQNQTVAKPFDPVALLKDLENDGPASGSETVNTSPERVNILAENAHNAQNTDIKKSSAEAKAEASLEDAASAKLDVEAARKDIQDRYRAELPQRVESMRSNVSRREREAAESAEQARMRPNDDQMQRIAKSDADAVERDRASLAQAERGEIREVDDFTATEYAKTLAERGAPTIKRSVRPTAEGIEVNEAADLTPAELAAFNRQPAPKEEERAKPENNVLAGWTSIAKNKDAFTHGRSEQKAPGDIVREIEPGYTIAPSAELAESQNVPSEKAWKITTPAGKPAELHQSKGKVWINVAALDEGEAGARIYNVAANYAHNNGLKFVGDPNGISDVALKRRPEQMLSSALKFGTTEHLGPHDQQLVAHPEIGLSALNWKEGDHAHNIQELARLTSEATSKEFPEIADIRYNPETLRFERANGTEVTNGDFKKLAVAKRVGPDSGDSQSDQDGEVRPSPTAGRRTLKRAVITKQLASPEGAALARLLAGDGKRGAKHSAGKSLPGLSEILYSRSEDGAGQASADSAPSTEQQAEEKNKAAEAAVTKVLGRKEVAALKENAKLHFVTQAQVLELGISGINSTSDLNGVNGFFDPKSGNVYVVSDSGLDLSDLHGIVVHEIVHSNMPGLLGDAGFRSVIDSFVYEAEVNKDPEAIAALAEARKNEANRSVDLQNEEGLAYYAQQNPYRPITKKMVDEAKLFLNRLGFSLKYLNANKVALREIVALNLKHAQRADKGGTKLTAAQIRAIMAALNTSDDTESEDGSDVKFQRVFHGTPHRGVEKTGFSLQKIGTGEGAQSYGWGMYFAGNKDIAEHYRKNLSDHNSGGVYTWDGRKFASDDYTSPERHAVSLVYHQGVTEARKIAKTILADAKRGEPYAVEQGGVPYAEKMLATANAISSKKEVALNQGQLYHAEIPEDSDLLDYDKPLSEQPEKVKAALATIGEVRNRSGQNLLAMDPTGEAIYKALGEPETASSLLNAAGIPGLRYLDGPSRNKGEGSANYVIWDETLLTPEKAQITPYYSRRSPKTDDPSPPFYSALTESVTSATGAPKSADSAAWKGWLDGAMRRGEFKQAERDWAGLDAWLDSQDGKITKQQLADFVRANEVQVSETVLGGPRTVRKAGSVFEVVNADGSVDSRLGREDEARAIAEGTTSPTKFAQWQLPGAENYRELLLTLPEVGGQKKFDRSKVKIERNRTSTTQGSYRIIYDGKPLGGWFADRFLVSDEYKGISDPEIIDAAKYLFENGNPNIGLAPQSGGFKSTHFDQPNILAHIRFNERTDADGKRVLFVEEIQSDWHQAGRKRGYAGAEESKVNAALKEYGALMQRMSAVGLGNMTAADRARIEELRPIVRGQGNPTSSVPDAPFKTTWPMLAFKRMVRYAAENDSLGNAAWISATKPESPRQQVEQHLGGELASVIPLKIMDVPVLAALKNDQVLKAVVKAIPVDVVNILSENGVTPENLLRKGDVFGKSIPTPVRATVARGLADALELVGTRLRTALDRVLSSDASGRNEEVLPAVRASQLDPRVVVGLFSPLRIYGLDGSASLSVAPSAIAGAKLPISRGDNSRVSGELGPTMLARFLNRHDALSNGSPSNSVTRYLAPEPFAKIAWTNGTQQAARYDLSKQVDSVEWAKYDDDRIDLFFEKRGQSGREKAGRFKLAEVEGVVGKDLAEKIAKDFDSGEVNGTYTGTDLKVGGEGMKSFYDQIVPGSVKAFAKKFDARPGRTEIKTPGYVLGDTQQVHSLDITEKMRDAAASGLPMFSRSKRVDDTPQTETAAFKKWFGESKATDSNGKPVIVHHVTSKPFTTVNMKKGAQGVFWVTSDKASIEAGETGAQGKGAVMDLYLKMENPAGWKEYEKMSLDEIESRGFDGVMLPNKDGTFDAIIFEPNQVKSANRNRGEFSTEKNSIIASRRTPADAAADNAAKREVARNTLGGPTTGGAVGWDFETGQWIGLEGDWNRARAKLDDSMLAWRHVQDRIAESTGSLIPDAQNVYRIHNLMHGRVSEGVKQLEDKLIVPLVKAMDRAGISVADLERYLHARHAQERNEYIAAHRADMPDGGSGLTTDEANKILAKLKSPEMDAVARRVDAIIRQTRQRLLDHGIITQAQFDALQAQYTHYVPLRGKAQAENDFEDAKKGSGVGRGIDGRQAPMKKAFGRGAGNMPENILGEIFGDAQRSIIKAEHARVGRSVLRIILANPNPSLWTVEPVQTEMKADDAGQIYEAVVSDWSDPSIIGVRHKGVIYKVEIKHAPLANGLHGMAPETLGVVVRSSAAVQRYLSAVLTKYNPAFMPVNLTRDLVFGLTGVFAEHGAMAAGRVAGGYAPAMAASWRHARGKLTDSAIDKRYQEYVNAGGKTGFVNMQNAEQIQKKLGAWRVGGYNPKNLAKMARVSADFVGDVNDAVENALRFSAFNMLMDQKWTAEKAAEYAKNITVNFNRKGTHASLLGAFFLFYNPGVQGTKAVGRMLKNPKAWAVLGAVSGLQLLGAMFAMGSEDDDGNNAWDMLPDYIKRRSLCFAWFDDEGQHKYISFPMSYGFNVFPYLTGRAFDMAKNSGAEKNRPAQLTSDVALALLESFSPIPVEDGPLGLLPPIMGIPTQVQANQGDFGRAIRNENNYGKYDKPLSVQGKAKTSSVFKTGATILNRIGMGDDNTKPWPFLDYAPEDLEFMFKKLSGGAGSFAADVGGLIEKAVVFGEVAPNDIPISKRFWGNVEEGSMQQGMYYDRRAQIEKSADIVRKTFQTEGPEAAQKLLDETPALDGASFKRYKTTDKDHKKGQIIVIDDRPQLVAKDEESIYAQYKAASKATMDLNERINDSYSGPDRPFPYWLTPDRDAEKKRKDLMDQRMEAQKKFNAAWNTRIDSFLSE